MANTLICHQASRRFAARCWTNAGYFQRVGWTLAMITQFAPFMPFDDAGLSIFTGIRVWKDWDFRILA
jgi:hypothetical protein